MTAAWTTASGWYRRDLGAGSYLMVTRSTLNKQLEHIDGVTQPARWFWRRHLVESGGLLAGAERSYADAYSAMAAGDRAVAAKSADVA